MDFNIKVLAVIPSLIDKVFEGFVEESDVNETSQQATARYRAVTRKVEYENLFQGWADIMMTLRKRSDFSDTEIEELQRKIDRFARLYIRMFGGNQVFR